jgi:hypothetical protein
MAKNICGGLVTHARRPHACATVHGLLRAACRVPTCAEYNAQRARVPTCAEYNAQRARVPHAALPKRSVSCMQPCSVTHGFDSHRIAK